MGGGGDEARGKGWPGGDNDGDTRPPMGVALRGVRCPSRVPPSPVFSTQAWYSIGSGKYPTVSRHLPWCGAAGLSPPLTHLCAHRSAGGLPSMAARRVLLPTRPSVEVSACPHCSAPTALVGAHGPGPRSRAVPVTSQWRMGKSCRRLSTATRMLTTKFTATSNFKSFSTSTVHQGHKSIATAYHWLGSNSTPPTRIR